MPHGSGGRVVREFGQTNVDFIKDKACFLKYKNPGSLNPNDEYCLPYAIVIGKAFIQSTNGEIGTAVYKNYQRSYNTLRKEALKLCRLVEVKISELKGGCSFDEVKKFQRVESKKPMYTDREYNGKYKLNIMLQENHYTAMRSVKACFGARYICPECHTHTHTKADHFCKYACTQCQSSPKCDPKVALITCDVCNRHFYGYNCYMNHLNKDGKGKTVCESKKNCPLCKSYMENNHVCGKRECFTCEEVVDKDNHFCHIRDKTKR